MIKVEWRKAPTSVDTQSRDTIHVSGLPPFDPEAGEAAPASIERPREDVLEKLKLSGKAAGNSLANVLECSVKCTLLEKGVAANTG